MFRSHSLMLAALLVLLANSLTLAGDIRVIDKEVRYLAQFKHVRQSLTY